MKRYSEWASWLIFGALTFGCADEGGNSGPEADTSGTAGSTVADPAGTVAVSGSSTTPDARTSASNTPTQMPVAQTPTPQMSPTPITEQSGAGGASTIPTMTQAAGGSTGGFGAMGGDAVGGTAGSDVGSGGVGDVVGAGGAGGAETDVMGTGGSATGGVSGAAGGTGGAETAGAGGMGLVEGVHPEDAVQFEEHWYRLTEAEIGGAEAQAICEELGGYLACVESEAEDAFVFTLAGTTRPWIGLNNEDDVNTWVWVNGMPVTYTHWQPGQPDAPSTERWVKVAEDGTWDDGNIPSSYICEWDS